MTALADRIDALLPQTQCQRCGYPDCRAYAEAIASDETEINRCPPGGVDTIQSLAELTGRKLKPLDPGLGEFRPDTVAFIDEPLCIGCTKCIQACPVDAIVGAAKQMHTVIESLCTGCELCIPPCPVDCIRMQPAIAATDGIEVPATGQTRADFFRTRYRSRSARLERSKLERQSRRRETRLGNSPDIVARRKAEIAAAVERVRARRARQGSKKS
ncbi:MAG TPA: RnfABCDGE type electron transport complex subunit B [Gammaproteobacteria bacterium]|nr:RnfABCDGE type electron transport complex subunit B [Gammaproteobacteria bacterium]